MAFRTLLDPALMAIGLNEFWYGRLVGPGSLSEGEIQSTINELFILRFFKNWIGH